MGSDSHNCEILILGVLHLNLPSAEDFRITEHNVAGVQVRHVMPQHIGCTWTKDNLQFRSSVWHDGDCISAGFQSKPFVEKITNAWNDVELDCKAVRLVIGAFRDRPRKEFALYVLEKFSRAMAPIAFYTLDHPHEKPMDKLVRRAIMESIGE